MQRWLIWFYAALFWFVSSDEGPLRIETCRNVKCDGVMWISKERFCVFCLFSVAALRQYFTHSHRRTKLRNQKIPSVISKFRVRDVRSQQGLNALQLTRWQRKNEYTTFRKIIPNFQHLLHRAPAYSFDPSPLEAKPRQYSGDRLHAGWNKGSSNHLWRCSPFWDLASFTRRLLSSPPSARRAFLAPNGYLPPPKRPDQLHNQPTFLFNLLRTKRMFYTVTHCVPRSKHTPLRL